MEKKIGIDISDTIVDVWPSLLEKADLFNKEHSNNEKSKNNNLYLPEEIYNFNEKEKKLFWSLYRDELSFNSPIKPGVKETLIFLRELSIKIYFITAKSNNEYIELEKKIINLLNENSIPYDEIYTQVHNKGLLCKEKDISYLVDDSYVNCMSAINHGKVALLANNPYNENRQLVNNMYRIKKIEEVKKYILR